MRARAVARPEARERAYPGLLQISLAFSLFAALLGVPGNHRRRLLMLVAAVALGLWIAPTATFTAEVEAGALVPRTEVARGVAVLEAIGGQLYVAVTIARLVGARQQGPRTTR